MLTADIPSSEDARANARGELGFGSFGSDNERPARSSNSLISSRRANLDDFKELPVMSSNFSLPENAKSATQGTMKHPMINSDYLKSFRSRSPFSCWDAIPQTSVRKSCRLILAAMFLVMFGLPAMAQIAAWDFTGEGATTNATSTPDIYNANLDSATSALTRGSGAVYSSGSNSFRTQNFSNNGISIANTDYFQFTLSSTSGYTLSLSSISAKYAGTATYYASPGASVQYAYSIDGGAFTLIGTAQAITAANLATAPAISLAGITALQNLADTSTVTFRFYASGQTTTGGFGFNSPTAGSYGLSIGGSLNAVAGTTYYWVGNNSTLGGAGIWTQSGGTSWSPTTTTPVGGAWDSTKLASFGGTEAPKDVTVSGTVNATAGIEFTTDAYNLTGGTVNLDGGSAIINSISTAPSTTATILSDLTALNGFTKSNLGTLVLGGAVTGNSTISAGTLILTGVETGAATISSASTLQIGNATASGALIGDVVDNGILAFNRTNSYTYSGAISGSGVVQQNGTGTTIFDGANTYTTTSITAGTLQVGSGGTTGTLGSGAVTNNSVLAFNRSDVVTVGNTISGSGAVQQIGGGTTILTANNSYLGSTTISTGTLQVGNGGTTGTLGAGSVIDNASLIFNRSNSITVSNDISGSGSIANSGSGLTTFSGPISTVGALTQNGSGTAILTGANSYGETIISSGTVQVGNGGMTGTLGSGAVTNNASLTFNRSDSIAVGNAIGGSGVVNQAGTGTTTLSGNNTYGGGTNVSSGVVVANANTALGAGGVTLTGGSLLATAGKTVSNNIVVDAVSGGSFTATYNFGSATGNLSAATTGSGFTASDLSRGNYNGIPDTGSALPSTTSASTGAGASGNYNAPLNAVGSTLNTATSGYFEFTLDATTATALTLNDVSFFSRSTSSGPLAYTLRSSLDGFNTDITSGSFLATSAWAQKNNPGLSVTGDLITFRIYGSGGSAATATGTNTNAANWRIDDLNLGGTTLVEGIATVGSDITSGTATFTGNVKLQSNVQLTAASGGTSVFSGNISDGTNGAKGIIKVGSGIVTLSGENSFSGPTKVSEGKLVAASSNALASTTSIKVESGATLLATAANAINSSATVNLGTTGASGAGGTLAISGNGGFGSAASNTQGGGLTGTNMAGLGTLTLSSNSTLDFGDASTGTMVFSGFDAATFTLNITNYSNINFNPTAPTTGAATGDDRLVFSIALTDPQLAAINFGAGFSAASQISLGGGFYEIGATAAAVPEPATVFGGLALLGLVGYRERRRVGGLVAGFRN